MPPLRDAELTALTPADAGEVLTLQRAAYASEAQLYADPLLPALTQSLEELREELTADGGYGLRLGPRLVGAVRTRVRGEEVHVGRLTVVPDLQGRGLGSRLLEAAETGSGASWAVLFTGHLSVANLRLYRRRGYRETHRTSLREGVDLVHLRKDLREDLR
ncbi:GNAT family N-acetyltransferase [Kineococcus sp. SYSU DK002]|uniref:GNAT family N-acetyltransferase n=1 Tax=Kineococcus sp. SYSU DK002 TaxID=3383123 RepID=UPI003D7DA989